MDLERAYILLRVVEKCAAHGSNFSAISTAAMKELQEMNSPPQQALVSFKEEAAKQERPTPRAERKF